MPIQNNPLQKQLVALFIACAIAIVSIHASAAKRETDVIREASVYIIKDGDFLGSIAIAHGVSIAELIEANGLDNPDKIYSGMELMIPGAKMNSGETAASAKPPKPKKVIVEVPKGFTLTRIAKVYNVSVKAILKANKKLGNPDNLRAGMKILIPGATEEIELVPPPPCFKPAVEFYRIRNDKTEWIHLTYCNGKPNPEGVEKLSRFAAPTTIDEMPFPLHPRLAAMLQKVADQFPGRRLEVVSGQGLQKRKDHESYHNKGQAIDFRVQGIPNRTLVNFARIFDNAGVGYYPNSVFIHMDTRERNAFWIDYSRPGEKAIYAKAGLSDEELEEIRASRSLKKAARRGANRVTMGATMTDAAEEEDILADNSDLSDKVEDANAVNTDANTSQEAVDAQSGDVESEKTDAPANALAAIQTPGQV